MAPPNAPSLARQARRIYLDLLARDVPATVNAVVEGARALAQTAADPAIHARRRDAALDLPPRAPVWQQQWHDRLVAADLAALAPGGARPVLPAGHKRPDFALVDDDTIEHDILASRLALAISDRATWQFTDLRARLSSLERFEDLPAHDLLMPQTLASCALGAWLAAGLSLEHWRTLQTVVHDEISGLAEAGYHEANRWLLGQGIRPEIDLRPFIRRSRTVAAAAMHSPPTSASGVLSGFSRSSGAAGLNGQGEAAPAAQGRGRATPASGGQRSATGSADDASPAPQQHAEVVLTKLNELMSRHLSDYAGLAGRPARPASARLGDAIRQTQAQLQQRFRSPTGDAAPASQPLVLEDLQQSRQVLKQAAATPVERATIEVVALMFQSILTDERIPASVRVWFARLQMPVLRVAVSEPDFFANVDHPARQLIDRMGSCVMGFNVDTGTVGDALEREIKRIVQVVEAYPDTGRRVFQTVLTEFERFLKHYFQIENEATRKGVSLAQQVEQRETLAIQYTIELRKMLNDVPVQEGVRDFLFHVWADVLATTAVKHGPTAEETKGMKRAAADLIWSASAKFSREERAEVIRRLPPLLKVLREGMAGTGMPPTKQEEQIQRLNNSLAAAFTAKAASISDDRLAQLMGRLETLDELLPEVSDLELDQSTIMDLSDYETENLEVVSGGGSAPTAGMIKWAQQLQVGSWYQLDYRNRVEPVQLVWQGVRKQLTLFSTSSGRGILFQSHRLAAFLQAGLLVPAEDESLTTRATRKALAKLDADPERLLS